MDDDNRTNEHYHRVLATANKLEKLQSNLESVIDFFLTPIVKLYSKLCNDCLYLLFECEFKLDHYRKAEELVWRRIYHDIYRFQKTKRQVIKRQDECLMESHFISGIGFYSSLIVKLRTHYKINEVRGVIAPLNLALGPTDNFIEDQRLNQEDDNEATINDNPMSLDESGGNRISSKAQEWARQAIYRSLVYMGDLARYLLETSQFDYRKLAVEFYRSASRYQPDHGLPFNQLATLSGGLNHNLDAVCNYMRCCLKTKPFEGAEGNMKKLFDLNRRFYDEIIRKDQVMRISQVFSSKEPVQAAESMMMVVIVNFIKLVSDLWTLISGGCDEKMQHTVNEEIRQFFEILREAIELDPIVPLATSIKFDQEFTPISGGSSITYKPKYVSPTIMYEFCSISIMLIAKYHKHQQSMKLCNMIGPLDTIINSINTLALNLLHYATSKCHKMIMSKLQELRVSRQEIISAEKNVMHNPVCEINLKDFSGNLSNSSQRSTENINSSSETTSRRTLSRLRQRIAATNYSDNNKLKPLSNHNEDSDLSELEETALSTIDALEISSEMSDEGDYHENDLINLDSSSDDNAITSPNFGHPDKIALSKPALRPTRSQNYELEKTLNLGNCSSSLPVPDLVTGDINDRMNIKVIATSQSTIESSSGSESRARASPNDERDISQSRGGLDAVLSYTYTQTYLPTIKIFCDWLLSDGTIVSSNMNSFRGFCSELIEMVSLLHEVQKRQGCFLADVKEASIISDTSLMDNSQENSRNEDGSIYKHVFNGPEWVQKYPISCDFPMMGLGPLKTVQEINIDFNYGRELNESEAGFVTIQCIIAFSHALSACLENKTLQ